MHGGWLRVGPPGASQPHAERQWHERERQHATYDSPMTLGTSTALGSRAIEDQHFFRLLFDDRSRRRRDGALRTAAVRALVPSVEERQLGFFHGCVGGPL